MDAELQDLIRETWRLLEQQGADHAACTEGTVRTVLQARPDMSASDALAAVRFVRLRRPESES